MSDDTLKQIRLAQAKAAAFSRAVQITRSDMPNDKLRDLALELAELTIAIVEMEDAP